MPKLAKHARTKKVIHPSSRKADKVGGKEIHKEKLKKVHRETSMKQSVLQGKLLWVKDHLDEKTTTYSKKDLCELVERYLERFDDELEQISIVQGIACRKKNQHASRAGAIKLTLEKEKTDFATCGIEIPDLCDGRNLRVLRSWQGEAKYLQNIKLRRVKRIAITEETKKEISSGEADERLGSSDSEEDDLEENGEGVESDEGNVPPGGSV